MPNGCTPLTIAQFASPQDEVAPSSERLALVLYHEKLVVQMGREGKFKEIVEVYGKELAIRVWLALASVQAEVERERAAALMSEVRLQHTRDCAAPSPPIASP